MKNLFAETYEKVVALRARYESASTESEKDEIRTEYNTVIEAAESIGKLAPYLLNAYFTSKDNGNVVLDINESFSEENVKAIVDCIRENGIEKFTFSSRWSGAVDVAWLFQKNGCALCGLVEINGNNDPFKGQHEKLHAYLFKVNR